MKYFLSLFIVVFSLLRMKAQLSTTDSLKQLLGKIPNDTNQVNLLLAIANNYYFYQPDTSIAYSLRALQLSRDLDYNNGIILSLSLAGEASRLLGDYPGSMKMQLEAFELSRKTKNAYGEASSLCFIGVIYNELKEYRQGLNYLLSSNAILQKLSASPRSVFALLNTGISYNFLNMQDSAISYFRQADIQLKDMVHPQLKSYIPINIGSVFAGLGNKDSALFYYFDALQNSLISNESINLGRAEQKIASLYFSLGQYDSSLYYVRNAFAESQRTSQKVSILESSNLLVSLFRHYHQMDSAFYYQDIVSAMKDSMYGLQKFQQLQLLMLEKQKKQQKSEKDQEQYRNNIKYALLFIALGVFLLFSFILLRANRQKQKANTKLGKAYAELKDTQALLIQKEKMASLGEVTAGIAHEIQNPLNFVNNFAEINNELIKELKEELTISKKQLATGDPQDAKNKIEQAILIANDVIDNSEKINHHGKRAESIVKGMLQHSRKSTGIKEPTDINGLADEYLRLAYHGLWAKDKTFNAEFKIDLDPSLPLVKIVPQDIGRVLLNLFNNAFWACAERGRLEIARPDDLVGRGNRNLPTGQAGSENANFDLPSPISHFPFSPSVSLTTKNLIDHIEIRIADNGPGIPPHIIDKIFQPFFTTKPTGQGTGLGLSLAYDIIKAHGGSLLVNTFYNEPGAIEIKLESATLNSGVAPLTLPDGTISSATQSRTESRQTGSVFIIKLPIA